MKIKHSRRTIIFIVSICTLGAIATNKSQTFAKDKYRETPVSQILLSQQNFSTNPKDETTIRQLTQKWIEGWSPGAETFSPEQLQPLYAQGKYAILVYDDIGEEVAVIRNWDEYAETWQPFMKQFTYWSIQPKGDIEVRASEDMAISNFVWIGEARYKDGREITPKQYATLVWEKQDGNWVIVHEHLTAAANN